MPTRRQALALFGGGAFVAAAGGLAWLDAAYTLLPGERPLALSRREYVVARALCEAMCPAQAPTPSEVATRVDEEVWAVPEALAADLKAALLLIEVAPLWLGYPGRLSQLDLPRRQAALTAMLTGDIDVLVSAVAAFKQMILLFYYADPRTWSAIGYDGPWVKTALPSPTAVEYARRRG